MGHYQFQGTETNRTDSYIFLGARNGLLKWSTLYFLVVLVVLVVVLVVLAVVS